MELLLWRHAEAAAGTPDDARPLTERGRRQAGRVARHVLPRLPAGLRILVSPARRAQETARALGRPFEIEARVAPGATAAELLDAAAWPAADRPVLVVGHQPTLGEVAGRLVAAGAQTWNPSTGSLCWLRDDSILLVIEPDVLERGDGGN
jgi:phosphohistidine phosphatase